MLPCISPRLTLFKLGVLICATEKLQIKIPNRIEESTFNKYLLLISTLLCYTSPPAPLLERRRGETVCEVLFIIYLVLNSFIL